MGLSVGAFTHSKDRKAGSHALLEISSNRMTFLVSVTKISNKKRSASVNKTKEHTN